MRLQADPRLKQNRTDLPLTCSSSRTIHILQKWIDTEPRAQFDQAYPMAKRLNTLLRHGELLREEDGTIEFWRFKDCLRYEFENSQHWSDEMWKSKMAGGGGHKQRFQHCTDPSGQEILCSELFNVIQETDGFRCPKDDASLVPFFSLTCLLAFLHISSHNTLHHAQMSHVQNYGVVIRIESVNKDTSHSWVGISHGLSWSRT